MAECANRHGSEIAGVRPEDIEVLISAEKLRGTDFCVGAIDATTSGQTRINPLRHRMYKSPPAPPSGLVCSIGTRRSGNSLWGPHCPAGMDLVAPQGHFRRAGQHPIVGFQPVRIYIFQRPFGELDGSLRHSPRF